MKTLIGLSKAELIELPKAFEKGGNLTFIEGGRHIPFSIKRVFYVYDVPKGGARGGHAHKGHEELIISASGSFDVILDDGFDRKRYRLDRSNYGLYVPNMIWCGLENFSSNSICLVLASEFYDEKDYIRNYEIFLKMISSENNHL